MILILMKIVTNSTSLSRRSNVWNKSQCFFFRWCYTARKLSFVARAEKLKPAVLKKNSSENRRKSSTLSLLGTFGLPGLICRDENLSDLIIEIVPKLKKFRLGLWRKTSIYFFGEWRSIEKEKNQFLQRIASSPYQQFFVLNTKMVAFFSAAFSSRNLSLATLMEGMQPDIL